MSLFNHAVEMMNLYTSSTSNNNLTQEFVHQVNAVLEIWKNTTPLDEQKQTIDQYNTTSNNAPYVSLWLFQQELDHAQWSDTFPARMFHDCLGSNVLKSYLPLVLQRLEQAVAENDSNFFIHWDKKSSARLCRRLIVSEHQERARRVVAAVANHSLAVFDAIRENLPEEYLREHVDELQAAEFLLNRELMVYFGSFHNGITHIQAWMDALEPVRANITIWSAELCQKIKECWKGEKSRSLSDEDNLRLVEFFASHYPTQLSKLLPDFFDLDYVHTNTNQISVPQWQAQTALQYFPERLPYVAGVLAENLLSHAFRDQSIVAPWNAMRTFFVTPGVSEYMNEHNIPIELRFMIPDPVNHWQNSIMRRFESLTYSHVGVQQAVELVVEFAGGARAQAYDRVEFGYITHNNTVVMEFEAFLQKKRLEQAVNANHVVGKLRKM